MVIEGTRLVFHGYRSVFMIFEVTGWFYMVTGRFLWFLKVTGWFFIVPGRFLWFFRFQVGFMIFNGSRSVFMVFHGYR